MSTLTAHGQFAEPIEMGDVLTHALAGSRYNRDLIRIVELLRQLRNRLAAFADRDPSAELVRGVVACGVPRSVAVEEVMSLSAVSDGPDYARRIAGSLVWVLETAADDLNMACER